VFDLDDTLFPESEFVQSGFRAVDAWLQETWDTKGFFEKASAQFEAGTRGNIFDQVLRELCVPAGAELVRQMVEVYRDHSPRINLFPDARWALDQLSGVCQLGLITDGYLRVQQRKVAALGISKRFASIVYSDLHGHEAWKPSPLPYQQVTRELGCNPDECVYIADNPAKDFITARKLNWLTIRVRRPDGEHTSVRLDALHEADIEIANLHELKQALAIEKRFASLA
jgi:putative hydrolase of the HAD superfamily